MTWETMALTAGLIVLFTVLFDIFDIQPQVGSFAFMRTFTYLVFVLFRIVMGFAVASILSAAEPGLPPAILAIVAVMGNITFLQNLSLKVGGEQVAQLSTLFQNYKDRMVKEEALRRAKRQDARVLRVVNRLAAKTPVDYLEIVLRDMLKLADWKPEAANDHIKKHKEAAEAATGGGTQPSDEYRRRYFNYLASFYAGDIAEMNLEYAEQIVTTRPWEPERSAAPVV